MARFQGPRHGLLVSGQTGKKVAAHAELETTVGHRLFPLSRRALRADCAGPAQSSESRDHQSQTRQLNERARVRAPPPGHAQRNHGMTEPLFFVSGLIAIAARHGAVSRLSKRAELNSCCFLVHKSTLRSACRVVNGPPPGVAPRARRIADRLLHASTHRL